MAFIVPNILVISLCLAGCAAQPCGAAGSATCDARPRVEEDEVVLFQTHMKNYARTDRQMPKLTASEPLPALEALQSSEHAGHELEHDSQFDVDMPGWGTVEGEVPGELIMKMNVTTIYDGLAGNSLTYIDTVLAALLFGIVSFTLLVALIEHFFAISLPAGSHRPGLWVFALVIASYTLLIPALTGILFSFEIKISFLGIHIIVTKRGNHQGPITESTLGVIDLLAKTGSWVGAGAVCLYAIITPSVKVILLIMGEYYRARDIVKSRRCIGVVQTISKWACPDMFAYILLLYLLRHLPKHCPFIQAPAKLDVGFSCFSVFCLFSTVSSLFIKPPDCLPDEMQDEETKAIEKLGKDGIKPLPAMPPVAEAAPTNDLEEVPLNEEEPEVSGKVAKSKLDCGAGCKEGIRRSLSSTTPGKTYSRNEAIDRLSSTQSQTALPALAPSAKREVTEVTEVTAIAEKAGEDLQKADDDSDLPPPPAVIRYFGYKGLMFITFGLFTGFAVLMYFAVTVPAMELSLNAHALVKPVGPLPAWVLPIIEESGILKMIEAKVPLWHCVREMLHYVEMLGEGNCIVALVMLMLAIAFPIMDMIVLVMAAIQLHSEQEDRTTSQKSGKYMHVAKFLGKLSMLDVMSMGVVVVCLAAAMYRKMGVVFNLLPGIYIMVAAESLHYATYMMVASAVAHANREYYSPFALCFCCN